MDLATMARRLREELRHGSLLDAYLVAAGLGQLADDHVHPEIHPLDRAAGFLAGHPGALPRIGGRLASALARAVRALRASLPGSRRVLRWRRELDELIHALAETQAGAAPPQRRADLIRAARALVEQADGLPKGLRRAVVRLPACFHAFDQRPSDLARLVSRFDERTDARGRPLLVVGVRTSGSYLAPLLAASLKADGHEDVRVVTMRPGRPLLRHERALVRSVARRGGLALLTDDPPVTGSSIAAAAQGLERAGFESRSVVLMLQVFGAPEVPERLSGYDAVLLPLREWTVQAALRPLAVQSRLTALMGPDATVLSVDRLPLAARRPLRGHLRGLFRARLASSNGQPVERNVLVEGVGLGYLGAHSFDYARLLRGFSPRIFGLEDGLLYREWIADERRVRPPAGDAEPFLATAIARYVAERRSELPAATDLSLRMDGEDPVWEVASSTISKAFGRAWPVAKALLTDRAVKRLLRVDRPAVVDGNTDLTHWFHEHPSNGSLLKVDVGENDFSNLGLSCFDPAFDLAGASARAASPSLARRLRDVYAELEGWEIDEERWLLYELAHLWARGRTEPESEPALRRARSRALQRYFADVYLRDVTAPDSGPLCALDIDGVLETEHLGFPATTPSAALALRALMLHGYRPVIATGRSLTEVIERSRAYGLAGGVAEYGAAIYESASGHTHDLLPDGAAAALDRFRTGLRAIDGVHLDGDYRFSVRAFTEIGGERRGLPPEAVAAALAGVEGTAIRAVEGEGQTDFVAADVDKGEALRVLATRLDAGGPFALAVGDTASDVPMAALASHARAPAHADTTLRRAGFELMGRPYQAGLAQAVAELIGHRPGRCAVCEQPSTTRERRLLLTVLAAPERGRRGMLLQAMKLAAGVR